MIKKGGVVLDEDDAEKVSEERLHTGGELLRGRKEGGCEGKENSFLSNPHEDILRCQKSRTQH